MDWEVLKGELKACYIVDGSARLAKVWDALSFWR